MKYEDKNCVFILKDFTLEIEEIENRDNIYIDDLDFLFNVTKSKRLSSLFGRRSYYSFKIPM
jgi:hypothetical protein